MTTRKHPGRDFCQLAGIPHVVGGLDEVYRYLLTRGYLVEHQVPYYRLPQKVSAIDQVQPCAVRTSVTVGLPLELPA